MTQSQPASRVSIVSVCFNSTAVLKAMLDSLPEACQVILSDNGSSDAGELAALAAAAGAELVANE